MTYEEIVVNGVTAYLLTPAAIPPENRNRLLVHLHGGCYMMGGGKGAVTSRAEIVLRSLVTGLEGLGT